MIAKDGSIIITTDQLWRFEDGCVSFFFDYLYDGYKLKATVKRQVPHFRRGFVSRFDAQENRLPFQFMARDFVREFRRDIDIYYRMPCI